MTIGLLFCISILAKYRIQTVELRPLLVLDLMTLPKPAKSAKQVKEIKKSKQPSPIKPKKVKKIAKDAPTHPLPKSAQHTKEMIKEKPLKTEKSVKPTKAQAPSLVLTPGLEDSLPNPVPIFTLTQLPRFLHREQPVYPEVMRSDGISGVVRLEALIDKKGQVRRVNILHSAGEYFDTEARRAIFSSSFYPAKIQNRPVAVLLRLPVKFDLY